MGKTRTNVKWALGLSFGIALLFYFYSSENLPSKTNPHKLYSTDAGDNLRQVHLSLLQKAKKTIDIVIYSIKDPAIIQMINQKAAEGVHVTLVYDVTASEDIAKQLRPEITVIPRKCSGLTHQQIVVVDRKTLLIGSSNLTTASMGSFGNLVSGIEDLEMAAWLSDHIRGMKRMGAGTAKRANFKTPGVSVAIMPDPSGEEEMASLIRTAEKTMKVAMFTWTHKGLAEEVASAKERGVDVEVFLDHNSSLGTSREVCNLLIDKGVKVFIYQPKKLLHYKTLMVDDKILVNGSTNWTHSAFHKNDDCYIVLKDLKPEHQEFLERMWVQIREKSERQYENRPIRARKNGKRGSQNRFRAWAPA